MEGVSREEALPCLLKCVASKEVAGFDSIECGTGVSSQAQLAAATNWQGETAGGKVRCELSFRVFDLVNDGAEIASLHNALELIVSLKPHVLFQEHGDAYGHLPADAISIPVNSALQHDTNLSYSIPKSLPASPYGFHVLQIESGPNEMAPPVLQSANSAAVELEQPKQAKLRSQPIPLGKSRRDSGIDNQRDKRFDPFKTWSGRFERQLSSLRGIPQEHDGEANDGCIVEVEPLPAVDRYFDALEGPELDTLRVSEVSVLPEDKKWPFLLRFPISAFGMCLGVGSQAILWKTLATSPSVGFLHVSLTVNLVLWCMSLVLVSTVSLIYACKIIFYFEAVRREYDHPVRGNFFFAPWIACLFLVQGVPPSVAEKPPTALWYALMAPIFCLEVKVYGQWMSGGQRRLSKVANPSNHLSIVGNFVGALAGASMGLREGPIFFFAVGLAHYTVLFVTLYQRLPTNVTLPKELHPVFFLFVAAPSVASMAWATINGYFDYGSRIAYFVALFLYFSLVSTLPDATFDYFVPAVRINLFRGLRFSLAWWAYTFPTTGFSIATIRYSKEVTNAFTQALSVGFSAISTFTVTALLVSTIVHAFVLRDLFPNDISIAITRKGPTSSKPVAPLRSINSTMKGRETLEI
ncbi:C4-dicarboxylate transporter malic acid transport protein [Musa troglodytarum]|uniref:C4-dicarboxylate transporter malic acid transport protein n=1 Tax=Musa troglodytarum TaxID=320322 RepID=A0A9E7HVN4_9LILI|nr:C4-dicarboxylate transporter malic acid transport protein [Musa troglodytarum]